MIDRRLRELINREIDRLNTKNESEELRGLLEKNPQADSLFRGFKKLSNELKQVRQADPPPHLRQNILTATGLRKKESKIGVFIKSFIESLRVSPAPRYAVVFVLGAFVGLSIMAIAVEEGTQVIPRESESIGTFLPPSSPERAVPADSERWNIDGQSGSIELHIVGEMALVLSRFEGSEPQRVEILYGSGGLELAGFRIHDGSISTLSVSETTLGFVCESSGFCSAGIALGSTEGRTEPVTIVARVYAGDNPILEKSFQIQ